MRELGGANEGVGHVGKSRGDLDAAFLEDPILRGGGVLGGAENCREEFYAITAERKITHPVVSLLTGHARRLVFG